LRCITFVYSHNKSGHKYGCSGIPGSGKKLLSFKLYPEERITEVITYEANRTIDDKENRREVKALIVGISFKTDGNRNYSFGPQNGKERKEKFKDYSLGFVYGKSGGYIDCLGFVWYKYCLRNSTVFE